VVEVHVRQVAEPFATTPHHLLGDVDAVHLAAPGRQMLHDPPGAATDVEDRGVGHEEGTQRLGLGPAGGPVVALVAVGHDGGEAVNVRRPVPEVAVGVERLACQFQRLKLRALEAVSRVGQLHGLVLCWVPGGVPHSGVARLVRRRAGRTARIGSRCD
jgi:hypothetical protein